MSESTTTVHPKMQTTSSLTPVIEWSYDIDTREFECDQQGMAKAFGISTPVTSLNNLFDHMLMGQQETLKQRILEVELFGGRGRFSCCMMLKNVNLVHVTISFERLNKRIIQGTIIPQLTITGCEELAKILETIFDLPNVGVLVADEDTRILGCNRAFELQMGYQNRDLVGLKTHIFSTSHHSQAFYDQLWQQINDEGCWCGNLLSKTANGSNQAHHLCIYRLTFHSGRILYLGFSTDISASLLWMKNRCEQQHDWAAFLPTRKEFELQLATLANESRNKELNIVMTLRPKFSERYLLEQQLGFADFIMRSRYTSIAGQLSRDVFVVCLQTPHCQWLSPVRLIQIAMKGFFNELRNEMGTKMHATIVKGQTGVSILGYDTNRPRQALAHAAQAMLSSISGEGSYFNFYDSELHSELVKRQHLEAFLEAQIESGLVDVYFQPIIDVQTGRVVKFEALARFYDENDAYCTQKMIAIIEDLELIAALDDVVCQAALKHFPRLQEIYGEEVGVTINRSLNTKLDSLQILQRSHDLIKASGVDPKRVTIELTETAYFEQDEEHTRALEEVRKEGIEIAIDDFGTGYSSFSYLEKGQFDLLKIDRKFIKNIHKGSTSYNIVKMVTELAQQMNVKVVAEGVESKQELQVLAEIGVDYMQGFLFSAAVPVDLMDKADSYEHLFSDIAIESKQSDVLQSVSHEQVRSMDPGEPLSLAVEYMNLNPSLPLVVLNENRCVGLITKETVNLHLTPSMGTERETERESRIWKRPVNQIMSTEFVLVDEDLPVSVIRELVKTGIRFPWVLCNTKEEYRGVLTQEDALKYLASL
ncbi:MULTISPECIES: sensor domain-containing phosphodiesterase [Vibrio]|jgi:PAS domain S-box-containing protein|uniref:sensor domain-containing phosphodiesterase n=1 Tax=Vibrio TaxID=662 RepID=UPI00211A668B|nr:MULTISPECIES: EAL domain-containing protein [Vibrio]ELA7387635.1 EAL domain-containing protein [Vibrio alginolyticus]ELB2874255.1 EAL domain-containing protein [Vibrio alginolyticus]MCQ9102476.1 EAL domain-containing protein [Vibrio alginolyticus]MDW1629182.1 EAL domain-containing protein [Vibrio sp. Y176]MDW1829950.1 EAL domain-containing protein [Vibrio sp. Vb1755]